MVAERDSSAKTVSATDRALNGWLFRDRKELENRFGLQMERISELSKTDKGKQELLQRMKKADPSLNGDIDKALAQVDTNIRQLEKKESFLKKMLMMPVRAVKAVGRTMWRHKVLSAVAIIAGIIALLYFTPTLAPAAGEYGRRLIEAFKTQLAKLKMPTPQTAVESAGKSGITGGPVSPSVARAAAAAAESPGEMAAGTQTLLEAAKDSSIAPTQLEKITKSAGEIFNSAIKAAPKSAPLPTPVIPQNEFQGILETFQ